MSGCTSVDTQNKHTVLAGIYDMLPAASKKQSLVHEDQVDEDHVVSIMTQLLHEVDVREVFLNKLDAASLLQLKQVCRAWRSIVRRELCNRPWVKLHRHEGMAEPIGVDSVTDLDVECLIDTGRMSDVTVARACFPRLERLHTHGHVAILRKVPDTFTNYNQLRFLKQPDNYSDVIEQKQPEQLAVQDKEESPPRDNFVKLLLASVACAGREIHGWFGMPLQSLRENEICTLEIRLHLPEVQMYLLALMLPVATSLRCLNFVNPWFFSLPEPVDELPCEDCAFHLADAVLAHPNMTVFCGIPLDSLRSDSIKELATSYKASCPGYTPGSYKAGIPGAIVLGKLLPCAKALTSLNLSGMELCGHRGGWYTTAGITQLCKGLKGSSVTYLNLSNNFLCGRNENDTNASYSNDSEVFTTEGITKLCEGLKESNVTELDLSDNGLCGVYCTCENEKEGDEFDQIYQWTSAGIHALCEGLRGTSVTKLVLQYNVLVDSRDIVTKWDLEYEGELRVGANVMHESRKVRVSWIDDGEYGDDEEKYRDVQVFDPAGPIFLAEQIQKCGLRLTTLDVSNNYIGKGGAFAFAEISKETTVITYDTNMDQNLVRAGLANGP